MATPPSRFRIQLHRPTRLCSPAQPFAASLLTRGGLGRTGLVASLLLIELGNQAELALHAVRDTRRGAVETAEREDYVLNYERRF